VTNFKRLTRGIKLLRDHVYDPLNSAIDLLTKSGLPIENYDKENGTFRLTFYFSWTDARTFGDGNTTAPFVLPALQDSFELKDYLIPEYQLVEVSVSQDTRAEPAYISGPDAATPVINAGEAAAFDLFIKEHDIDASTFDGFKTETYSVSVPEIALTNDFSRSNPFVQSGMGISFTHKKSYLLQIRPQTDNRGFYSFCVSLKFKTSLGLRGAGVSTQNNTDEAGGNYVPQAAVVPASNSTIEADTNDGVNTGFKVADAVIQNKLVGGYSRSGQSAYAENLRFDAGYEVIAVPMFGGWGTVYGGLSAGSADTSFQTAASMPWAGTGAGNFKTMDRAQVALQHPLSIEHVVLAVNYSGPAGGEYSRPSTAGVGKDLTHEVGIGLLSGVRADNVEVKQVAHASWTPTTIGNYLIDRGDFTHNNTSGRHTGYAWDLLSCPIVTGPSGAGVGYKAQGKPMFAAQGMSNVLPRVFPVTSGAEQVLDIRWKIFDTVSDVDTWSTSPKEVIVGYRGCWVYLICKKFLR
jgi:hypothetical protein